MNPKALILLSGGIDSVVCAEMFASEGYDLSAIGFDYGQPHKIELSKASEYCQSRNIDYQVLPLPFIPKVNDIVFAGRNAVMLSVACSVAQASGIPNIVIGCNAGDEVDFPDCRLDFISAMQTVCATYGATLHAPLLRISKSEILRKLTDFNLSLDSTWTCYAPAADGKPCGECYACRGVKNAQG